MLSTTYNYTRSVNYTGSTLDTTRLYKLGWAHKEWIVGYQVRLDTLFYSRRSDIQLYLILAKHLICIVCYMAWQF